MSSVLWFEIKCIWKSCLSRNLETFLIWVQSQANSAVIYIFFIRSQHKVWLFLEFIKEIKQVNFIFFGMLTSFENQTSFTVRSPGESLMSALFAPCHLGCFRQKPGFLAILLFCYCYVNCHKVRICRIRLF